jgi:uncharacterized protein YpmB
MRRWFVLLVCVLTVLTTVPVSVLADMNMPEFKTGDKWEYSANLKMEDVATLSGDWIYEVQGETQESGHQVYDMSLTGDGSATFDGIGIMPFTLDGYTYLRVSDLALVKESMALEFDTSILGFGAYMSVFVNMTYAPPVNSFDFPLKEGDTWSSSTSTTISIDMISSLFPSSSTSVTIPVSTEYEVESKETVEVAAGKFSCYVIKGTEADGNTSYTYMSNKAGYMVKSRLYNSTGASAGTMNLKSYSYTAPGGNGGLFSDIMDLLWLLILLVIIIIVIVLTAILRSRGRREQEPQVAEQLKSEQEEPPPA